MDALGMTLIFTLLDAAAWLVYAAAAAAAWELVSLLRALWREHNPATVGPLALF